MPELSYREAIRDALSRAMRKDEDVFIMGEDIAEMGGSMGVTQGLVDEFGPERVRNTPISEMALAGAAMLFAAVTGITIGIYGAWRPGSRLRGAPMSSRCSYCTGASVPMTGDRDNESGLL